MTNSSESEVEEQSLAWSLVFIELLALVLLSVGTSLAFFSVLPIDVAILVFALASVSFPFLRKRVAAWVHVTCVIALWAALLITLVTLIVALGPEAFNWLLDWN